MRVVILRTRNIVVVDGVGHDVDCSALDPAIYVIEWNGVRGHIEYFNDPNGTAEDYRSNEVINDFSPYMYLLDAWQYAEDHPPPPIPPPPSISAGLVAQSFYASQVRAADAMAAAGDVYGAVKKLLNMK